MKTSSGSVKRGSEVQPDAITSGRIGRMLREAGDRLSVRLFESLKDAPETLLDASSVRNASVSFKLAIVIATLIHASTLLLACWAIYALLSPGTGYLVKGIALMVACVCWSLRPRLSLTPENVLARADFTALYGVADKAAQLMGAPRIDGICVTPEFNASYRVAGWGRGKRYMTLGLPLLYSMSQPERVAVISHELAHGANGDPLRSRFLWSAISTLRAWAILIRPVSIGRGGQLSAGASALQAWCAVPFELLMLLFSNIALWIASGVELLVMRQSQRAEYLADALAASVAGRDPMHRALRKTDLYEHIHQAFIDMALLRSSTPLKEIVGSAAEQPADVFEALAERSRNERWRVDATHPPTALRVELMGHQAHNAPRLTLSRVEAEGLEMELLRLSEAIHRELMNTYREIALPSF